VILADTSVWIDHLRKPRHRLQWFLDKQQVAMHPFVLGELMCGYLTRRKATIELMESMPQAVSATDVEARAYIEQHALAGRGLGYIDIHLLASTALTPVTRLWTLDVRVAKVAEELSLSFDA
jgi:predicted nucleic acid-binding protein